MTHPTQSDHRSTSRSADEDAVTERWSDAEPSDGRPGAGSIADDRPGDGPDQWGDGGQGRDYRHPGNQPAPAGSAPSPSTLLDDAAAATVRAEQPVRGPSDGQLTPGSRADDPVAALWGTDLVQRYREQWQQLQLRFVDDPQAVTKDAAGLVDDAVRSLTTTLVEQKHTLDSWQETHHGDTEVLRAALTRYRDYLDRLLGL